MKLEQTNRFKTHVSGIEAATFHRRFLLLFGLFSVLIGLAGGGNIYLQNINERLERTLTLSREQHKSFQSLAEKFRYITSDVSVPDQVLHRIGRDIFSELENIRRLQSELEVHLNSPVRGKDPFWSIRLTIEKIGMSDVGMDVILKMYKMFSDPMAVLKRESILVTRPLESAMLLRFHWRDRFETSISIINRNIQLNFKATRLAVLTTFAGLLAIIVLIYTVGFRPMLAKLKVHSDDIQFKLELHEVLATLVQELSSRQYLAFGDITQYNELTHSLLNNSTRYNLLKGSRIVIHISDRHSSTYHNDNVISVHIGIIGTDRYDLALYLGDNIVLWKNEIFPFVKALANHLCISLEIQLRLKVELQRDLYYQITDTTINALPSPVAVFDRNGKMLLANPAFSEHFSLVGLEYKLADIETINVTMVNSTLQSEGGIFKPGAELQENIDYADNLYSWIRLPVQDVGHIFIGHDVTSLRDNLQELGHQRSLEYLGRMTGSVAHDTNNFLSVIMNSLELVVVLGKLRGRARKYIEQAILTCEQAWRK